MDQIPADKANRANANANDNADFSKWDILIEYKNLADVIPRGMYVLPIVKDAFTWDGALFLSTGLYKGCTVRFRLDLPRDNYPNSAPMLEVL